MRLVIYIGTVESTILSAVEKVSLTATGNVYGVGESVLYKSVSEAEQSFRIYGLYKIEIVLTVSCISTSRNLSFENELIVASDSG